MSASKIAPSLKDHLAASQATVDKAVHDHQRRVALIECLPAGTPSPHELMLFGYCSEQSIRFDATGLPSSAVRVHVEQLMKLYPAMPLVDVTASTRTQKPRAYLRGDELTGAVIELYPVSLRCETAGTDRAGRPIFKTTARWWTQLAVGVTNVLVEGVTNADMLPIDMGRFQPDVHSYSTGQSIVYLHRLANSAPPLSALEKWAQAWEDFATAEGYNTKAKAFMRAARSFAHTHGRAPTAAELPEPHAVLFGQPTAIRVPESVEVPQVLVGLERAAQAERLRKEHQWDRLGDFQALFPAEKAAKLLSFVEEQLAAYEVARHAQQADFDRAKLWLKEFLGPYSSVGVHPHVVGRLRYRLRKDTGVNLELRKVANHGPGRFAVWIRLAGAYERSAQDDALWEDLIVHGREDGPVLQPQHIAVDYA